MLKSHFLALEDRTGMLSATELLKNPNALVPLDALPKGSSTSYYWLKTTLQTSKMATDPGEVGP